MEASTFLALALSCAPGVHATTVQAVAHVESSLNPWAIGAVGGVLKRQPASRAEALATARDLEAKGWNFSVGLGQINARNFGRLGLTLDRAFEPCTNLAAMQTVLTHCFERASTSSAIGSQTALRRALSCYYSGDFSTGFRHGYVRKVVAAAPTTGRQAAPTPLKEKS